MSRLIETDTVQGRDRGGGGGRQAQTVREGGAEEHARKGGRGRRHILLRHVLDPPRGLLHAICPSLPLKLASRGCCLTTLTSFSARQDIGAPRQHK